MFYGKIANFTQGFIFSFFPLENITQIIEKNQFTKLNPRFSNLTQNSNPKLPFWTGNYNNYLINNFPKIHNSQTIMRGFTIKKLYLMPPHIKKINQMSTKKVDIRKLWLLCEINFSQKKIVFEMWFIELCFQYRCKKDWK